MKSENVVVTWEDIIFESRNKEYGAYHIRKSYNENVTKASLIMILLASLVCAALQVASLMNVKIKLPVPRFSLPKQIPTPKIIPDPPRNRPTVKVDFRMNNTLPPLVVSHPVIEIPPEKPIDVSNVGDENGTEVVSVDVRTMDNGPTKGNVTTEPHEIFNNAELMPEYMGGTTAMIKFLQKNLHYPASAKRMGIEGTVFVRFIVSTQGEVTGIEIVRGISAELDREAMRVIAQMGKWKPGRQHDSPVSVRMVLPIKFKLEE